METRIQTSTATQLGRYLPIFQDAKTQYASAPAHILSFGCSTGVETETLSGVWPDAVIEGVEINDEVRAKAIETYPHRRFFPPSELAGQYDLVTAMSVLCSWPEKSYGILNYGIFVEACKSIDRCLKPGGLLICYNYTYSPLNVLTDYEALPGNSYGPNYVASRAPDGTNLREFFSTVYFRKPS